MRKGTLFTRYAALAVSLGLTAGMAGCLGIGEKSGAPGPELKRMAKEPILSVYDNEAKTKKQMPIEEYICGVVAGEMLPNWSKQAYEAQAIVARTFTMDLIKGGKGGAAKEKYGADVSTDEKETQAYNASAITPVIRQAVKDTRGYVITYRGKYIRAYFHACAGGRTAKAKEGLNLNEKEFPYSVSVKVDESKAPPEAKAWTASVPLTEVASLLSAKGMGGVTDIKIAKRGPSKRVTQFALTTANGAKTIAGNDLRLLIGPEKMRSTLLTSLSVNGGNVEMSGKGFGHGVGLSQWAANTMGSKGKSGRQIVRRFWKNIRIEQAWK